MRYAAARSQVGSRRPQRGHFDLVMNAPPAQSKSATLYDVLRHWAKIQPDAPVFVADNQPSLTYAAFAERIDGVRAALNRAGFGRGDRIGIVHDRNVKLGILMIGIESGATAVPLNPNFTTREVREQLRNLKVKAVLVEDRKHEAVIAAAEELGLPRLDASTFDPGAPGAQETRSDPSSLARPEDTAIVYGTSGTTSGPKLVSLSHATLMDRMERSLSAIELRQDDRSFLLRRLYYSGGHNSLCRALYSGGSAYFFDDGERNPTAEDFVRSDATWTSAPPAVFRSILTAAKAAGRTYREHRLRFLLSQSAALDVRTQREVEELFGVPVLQSYSSTETGWITANPPNFQGRKLGSVGVRVIEELKLAGPDGRPVTQGESGEVLVRGLTVIDGYENNPEANAEAFLDGWYRTGDEGYFDVDGYLFLTGRIKEVINRGGEKISPVEVDAALMEHPGVLEAATFPIPHPTLGEEVAVAVVPALGTALTSRLLNKFLLERLAGFKLPCLFIFVDAIPKSETGKLQRFKLAEALQVQAEAGAPADKRDARAPTPLEAKLQAIWSATLGHDRTVGLDDNFFLLGGDSLKAIELCLAIEEALAVRIPPGTLFHASSVSALAEIVRSPCSQERLDLPPLAPTPRDRPLPLSLSQEIVWEPESGPAKLTHLVNARCYGLTGTLDRRALEASMNGMTWRHEILRTSFTIIDDQPVQIVNPHEPVELPFVDLSSEVDPQLRAWELARAEAETGIDCRIGPWLRFLLIRTAPEEHWLLRINHHIISDAWSWNVYFRELGVFYEARISGKRPLFPEQTPLQYGDYAVWQRQTFRPQAAYYRELVHWWTSRYAEPLAKMALPFRRGLAAANVKPADGVLSWSLDEQTSSRLDAIRRQKGTTYFLVRLAAFALLLSDETRQAEIAVEVPVTNRIHARLQHVLGLMANVVPVRISVDPDGTFIDWLNSLTEQIAQYQMRSAIPRQQLKAELRSRGIALRDIPIVFAVSYHRPCRRFAGLDLANVGAVLNAMPWGFYLNLDENGGDRSNEVSFDAALYDPVRVREFIDRYRKLLEAISLHPELPMRKLLKRSGPRQTQTNKWIRRIAKPIRRLRAHPYYSVSNG